MSMKKNTDLLQAIKKGGSVSRETPLVEDEKTTCVQLRIMPSIIARIDKLCKARKPLYFSRHQWMGAKNQIQQLNGSNFNKIQGNIELNNILKH